MKLFSPAVLWACMYAVLPPLVASGAEESVTKDIVTEKKVFPSRPEGATVRFAVSSPKFEAPVNVTYLLGGPEMTAMLKSTFENLLVDAQRFNVRKEGKSPYTIVGAVTTLTIRQGKEVNVKENVMKGFISNMTERITKNAQTAEAVKGAMALDIKNETEKVTITCGVSVQLLDAESTILEKGVGSVVNEITVKDMRVALGGVNVNSSEPPMSVVAHYNTSLVERALFNALVEMAPKLDARLADPNFSNTAAAPAPAPEAPTPGVPGPVSAAPPAPPASGARAPAFCSACGTKLGAGANFCGGCGTKVAR